MRGLLERLWAVKLYAKDCHYFFDKFGQHLLADVNAEERDEQLDLINEVCFLGLGENALTSKEVLEGAIKYVPDVTENGQENLARLKALVKQTLVYIQKMDLKIVGVANLVGGIAQDLLQLHGLLYRDGVLDEDDIISLENYTEDDTGRRHSEEDGEFVEKDESTSTENVVDLSDRFKQAPSFKEVKEYIRKIFSTGVKFATLSPDFFIDIQGNKDKRNHIVRSSQFQRMSDAEKGRHNMYLKALEDIISKAQYDTEKQNTKLDKKPNVEKYHYFYSMVKLGENTYKVKFVAEQYKGESEEKPQTVHLYDVIEIK